MTIEIDVNINGEELLIKLSGQPIPENDSFTHEFGTDRSSDYFIVEEVAYDKSLYTAEQNRLIEEYISKNYNDICDKIIYKYENELV